uniref:Uncharacterized protein n=1 Tax=Arundo donax TaxID=35708 RepID=A0A0A9A6B3_ARUDO
MKAGCTICNHYSVFGSCLSERKEATAVGLTCLYLYLPY